MATTSTNAPYEAKETLTQMNMKAVSLLSGGLDSLITTKIIVEQGIEVEALHFTSPFCTCSKGTIILNLTLLKYFQRGLAHGF